MFLAHLAARNELKKRQCIPSLHQHTIIIQSQYITRNSLNNNYFHCLRDWTKTPALVVVNIAMQLHFLQVNCAPQ